MRREVNLVLLYNLLITTISPFSYGSLRNIPRYVVVIVLGIGAHTHRWLLRYGRYKLIKISMWLVWVCVVIRSAMSIAFQTTGEFNGSSLPTAVNFALLIFTGL